MPIAILLVYDFVELHPFDFLIRLIHYEFLLNDFVLIVFLLLVVVAALIGVAVGLTGAYASDWSLISMYLLLIAVVTFRARGLLGKKSILER